MLQCMKNIFCKAIEEVEDLDSAMEQYVCKFENAVNNDCELIQQLREKQALEKILKKDITSYENNNHENMQYILKFLKDCKNVWARQRYYDSDYYFNIEAISMIQHIVCKYSSDDIQNVANELVTLKKLDDIIIEKKSALKAIQKDISDIKAKLDIV